MTPSTGLSSRRSYLRRPKVCITPDNPGRCEPPVARPPDLPTGTCELLPDAFEINIGDDEVLDFEACCLELGHGEAIEYVLHAEFGTLSHGEGTTTNCDEIETLDYAPPDFECIDTLTVTATWSDTGVCIATSLATVVEEDEE